MIGSLPLGFAQPLVLLGLLSLPVLWWLLRLVPPRPRQIDFPPTRLLFEIAPKEETPARTPWWLTLLRLTLAALVIIAAAGPLWNPPMATVDRSTPLLILIDDGWPAASTWDARLRTADEMIARAEADNRGVAVLPISETERDISLQVAGAARVQIKQIKPKPYGVDRTDALPGIERFLANAPNVEVIWLSDGTDLGKGAAFVEGLKRIIGNRPLTVVEGGLPIAHALTAADNAAGALTVKVLRTQTSPGDVGTVNAIDLKGLPLGEAPFSFKSGERETDAVIDLPVEIRNDVARLEVAGERSAGAVQLLDKRWRRRTVGVVSGSTADRSQPLIGATYYLARALNPFADVSLAEGVAPTEAVTRFLDRHLPMLILADVGNVTDAVDRLNKWIDDGGVLVRFAGPHLASGDDNLVPVKLRRGGRILGGSLSWEKPQPLAAFSRESPFNGMTVPNDVTVTRQVLAEPDSQLTDRTWATLADGTPLVTAERRGKGLLVLFHVTADSRWSDLPLSGAFVDMLRRLVAIAGSTATAEGENSAAEGTGNRAPQVVPATRVLDGFGAFTTPPPTARPIPSNFTGRGSLDHPPGFYGPPEGLVAVNTLAPADRPAPLDVSPLNARNDIYRHGEPLDLRGPIFLAALALLMLDAVVVLMLSGGLTAFGRRRRAAAAVLLAGLVVSLTAHHPVRA
ncbi:MAG TPA: BatA domain-containing protein, partial [Burkholderiales bacterium]